MGISRPACGEVVREGLEKGGETDLFRCLTGPVCHALCRCHRCHRGMVIAAQGQEKVRKNKNKKGGGRCTLTRTMFSCPLASHVGAGPRRPCCSHRGYGLSSWRACVAVCHCLRVLIPGRWLWPRCCDLRAVCVRVLGNGEN